MAGLLAWAADVVGGGGGSNDEDDAANATIPIIFTPEQQRYAIELDQKSASLSRSIQDLRLRIPPADIAQRLPHLHAHSLASSAALALQLNAHSSTREQVRFEFIGFFLVQIFEFGFIFVLACFCKILNMGGFVMRVFKFLIILAVDIHILYGT